MTSIPLVRMLTDAGYGSRRDASKLVNAGLVQVNGQLASSYTAKVDPETDSVVVTGSKVAAIATRRVYLLMNKPEGYLTATEDDRDRPTVMELLPESVRAAGLHPAGRLDEDTTGLLILTNDGQLTYELTHPRFEHEKEYWVATTGRLTDDDLTQLEEGVEIEDQVTWPAKVKLLLGQSPYTYSITIHEGRKRQVRMMFAAIGQQVALLKRVRMGGLLLGDLAEGSWRELTPPELKDLMRKRPPDKRPSTAHAITPHAERRRVSAPVYEATRRLTLDSQTRRFAAESDEINAQHPDRPSVANDSPARDTPDRVLVWRSSDERLRYEGPAEPRYGHSSENVATPSRSSRETPQFHGDRHVHSSERRDFDGGETRRTSPAMGHQRDYRSSDINAALPAPRAAFRRPPQEGEPGSFGRQEFGARDDGRGGPAMRERDSRPFDRRDSGPRTCATFQASDRRQRPAFLRAAGLQRR